MRRIFQLRDQDGGPQGGHVFEAPTEEALASSIAAQPLPDGWSMEPVDDEESIIPAPVVADTLGGEE